MMKFYLIIAMILLSVNAISATDESTHQRTLRESSDGTPEEFFWFGRNKNKPASAPASAPVTTRSADKPTKGMEKKEMSPPKTPKAPKKEPKTPKAPKKEPKTPKKGPKAPKAKKTPMDAPTTKKMMKSEGNIRA